MLSVDHGRGSLVRRLRKAQVDGAPGVAIRRIVNGVVVGNVGLHNVIVDRFAGAILDGQRIGGGHAVLTGGDGGYYRARCGTGVHLEGDILHIVARAAQHFFHLFDGELALEHVGEGRGGGGGVSARFFAHEIERDRIAIVGEARVRARHFRYYIIVGIAVCIGHIQRNGGAGSARLDGGRGMRLALGGYGFARGTIDVEGEARVRHLGGNVHCTLLLARVFGQQLGDGERARIGIVHNGVIACEARGLPLVDGDRLRLHGRIALRGRLREGIVTRGQHDDAIAIVARREGIGFARIGRAGERESNVCHSAGNVLLNQLQPAIVWHQVGEGGRDVAIAGDRYFLILAFLGGRLRTVWRSRLADDIVARLKRNRGRAIFARHAERSCATFAASNNHRSARGVAILIRLINFKGRAVREQVGIEGVVFHHIPVRANPQLFEYGDGAALCFNAILARHRGAGRVGILAHELVLQLRCILVRDFCRLAKGEHKSVTVVRGRNGIFRVIGSLEIGCHTARAEGDGIVILGGKLGLTRATLHSRHAIGGKRGTQGLIFHPVLAGDGGQGVCEGEAALHKVERAHSLVNRAFTAEGLASFLADLDPPGERYFLAIHSRRAHQRLLDFPFAFRLAGDGGIVACIGQRIAKRRLRASDAGFNFDAEFAIRRAVCHRAVARHARAKGQRLPRATGD